MGTDLDKKFVFVVGSGQDHSVPARARWVPSSTACASCAAACRPAICVVVNGLQRVRPGVKVDPVIVAMDEPAAAAAHSAAAGQK